jgi:acetyl-CoA carboxylase biotin carboxyl carrier protein
MEGTMNLKEIKELIKIIDSSSLSELHIEQQDLKLTLKKEVIVQQISTAGFPMSEYAAKEGIIHFNPYNLATGGITGANAATSFVPTSVSAVVPPLESASTQNGAVCEAEADAENIHIIKSPIVGVFYGSPTPEAPQFVKLGDKVKVGQVLCIVEAMKMMNEITSEVDGEVVEIFGQNQEPVEYGQSLFKIRKA